MGPQDWPSLLGIIQTVLNEAPLAILGIREDGTYLCPLEVMTGITPRRTLIVSFDNAPKDVKRLTINRVHAENTVQIEQLQASLLQMHKEMSVRTSKNRFQQLKAQNKRANVVQPNLHPG